MRRYIPSPPIGQWLAPHLDLGGVALGGTAREVTFNWDDRKDVGHRLSAAARLADISITPPSRGFVLAGMSARVTGNEDALEVVLESSDARLDLAGSPQYPLQGVRVASRLRIARVAEGWQIASDRVELRHEAAKLELAGTLTGGGATLQPELVAHGQLTDADVLLVQRALGTKALGNVSASVTGGRVEHAESRCTGLSTSCPMEPRAARLLESLQCGMPSFRGMHSRPVAFTHASSGADPLCELWWTPGEQDLSNSRMRQWNGIQQGEGGVHAVGQVTSRMEDALAWLQAQPRLDEYAPGMQNVGLEGNARLDFNLSVPEQGNARSRVVASLEGARLQWASGAVPIQNLTGSLAFDGERLQRSTLTGTWLGGPVSLAVDERRDRGQVAIAMQARGTMAAQQLAALAAIDAKGRLAGNAEWSGDLTFLAARGSEPARWRVRADSTLVGVASELPEPLESPPTRNLR